ncbi:MAG: acylphosphatase [Bacteroidia bacterium]|nr:acylphosphatase [Bacteroidia bacterium]
MIRRHYFFSGKVQGVWFRATSKQFAQEIGGINGWVKNLPDGRVECLAEGPASKLQEFEVKLEQKFNISGIEYREEPALSDLQGFEIIR